MVKAHSFHLPVMGIGFSVDTAIKVAHYGIDSVSFIGDNVLLEKLRKKYCETYTIDYQEIDEKVDDYRAKRITSYLNLMKDITELKFDILVKSGFQKGSELYKYYSMLPEDAGLKTEIKNFTDQLPSISALKNWAKSHLTIGDINVNIMTKLDKPNYRNKKQLPIEFNDAHTALRGYANSNLNSSVVFSAGMNPRLYSYLEQFSDFYPDINGEIKKRITLKVSDYRSALIQGKFLAKKGLWVSEYRIESGLNCGGHAFATEGYLMGPILEEFKNNKTNLEIEVFAILTTALKNLNKTIPQKQMRLKVSAQGGVGTKDEHNFLLNYYKTNSVGWGTPFLLCPEVTNVDKNTLQQLLKAKEDDLYLSSVSPLGVPFNNLRGNSKDLERDALKLKNRPGSSCPKKILALNYEFDKQLCTASREYQHLKIKELDAKKEVIAPVEYQRKYNNITEKSCICVGLGTSVLHINELDRKKEGDGVSVCPGPNMAYYDKKSTLEQMLDHIYRDKTLLNTTKRPNIFVKEFDLYLSYFKTKIEETSQVPNRKEKKYLINFSNNMTNGLLYYKELFKNNETIINQLAELGKILILYKKLADSIINKSTQDKLSNA